MAGGEEVGKIFWDSRIETKNFKKDADDLDNHAKGLGSKVGGTFAGIGKAVGVGMAVAGTAAVAFGVKSVGAYNDSVMAGKKLETNMLNVKGATMQQVDGLQKLASQLQAVGVIEDDVIVAGMSQLATFNLQSSSISTLTPKITDMVAQLKGHNATAEDMVGINNLIGKVMTGNVGALGRYGVTLDENSKKILTNGTESEKAAELVKVLEGNYGKVNEALRDTPEGRITGLKNAFGDFMEIVGGAITSIINPIVKGFEDWAKSMGGVEGIMESLGNAWKLLTTGKTDGGIFGLTENSSFIKALKVGNAIIGWFKDNIKALALVITVALVPAFVSWAIAQAVALAPVVLAVAIIGLLATGITWLVEKIGGWNVVLGYLKIAWDTVIGALTTAYNWFSMYILPILTTVYNFVVTQFIKAWNDISSAVMNLIETMKPFMPILKVIGVLIGIALIAPIVIAIGVIIAIVAVVAVLIAIFMRIIGVIASVIAWFVDLGVRVWNAMNRFKESVQNAIGGAIEWFKSLPSKILGAIGNFGNTLYNSGKDLIQGLINGIKGMAGNLVSSIKSFVIDKIPGPIKKALGINSPSTVFMGFGKNIVQGLTIGIDKNAGMAEGAVQGMAKSLNNGFGLSTPAINTISGMQSVEEANRQPIGGSNNIGVVNINNEIDGNYWLNKLTGDNEAEMRGLTPQRAI